MNKYVTGLISFLALISWTHAAETLPITPGLWEIKTTTTTPFSGSKDYSSRECMAEDSLSPNSMMKDMPADACEVDSSVSGNTITYNMNCAMQGQQMTGIGTFTVNGDTAKGEMTMSSSISGQKIEVTTTSTGKRIGDC